ncbi:PAS domain S-box protein [Salinivibrio sp. ES.052]|uniref:sensor histidine kinase n=1 Tax=Salinivibrio sp. ES.052 TaxID=1882823 RepID=UPI0015881BF4|nr:PAS domain S-box protein [Salinivibrio sp. ES.052]
MNEQSTMDGRCIRGSQAHYKALVESAAAAILVIDEQGIILDANPFTHTLLGYAQKQLVGQDIECLMPPEHQGKHGQYLRKYLSTGEPNVIGTGRRVTARHREGHLVPVHLAVSEVWMGERREFIGVMSDLRALTQAQTSVQHERNRLKTIIDAIGNPVFVRELGGHYALANRACLQAVKADHVSQLAEAFGLALPDGMRDTLNALEHQLTVDGEPVHVDVTLRDGRTFKLAKTLIHHLAGEPYAIVTVAYDATPLLQAMQKAEHANQAKSDFLSAMSHELRTPLNSVLGYAQLLLKSPAPTLAESQRQYVEQIHQSGRHLLALINDVLDLAKIEAGKITLNPIWYPMHAVVNDAIQTLSPLAERQKVSLQNCLPTELEGELYVDPTRFKQVLINLLSNAVKYNHPQGRVWIDAYEHDGNLTMSVNDTGIGIADDQLDGLFEPFNRLVAEDSLIEGAGVGLAVTYQLVSQMQGEIRVASQMGKGSAFSVTFPYRAEPQHFETAVTEPSDTSIRLTQPHRVLYIDQDSHQQRLVSDCFEDWPLLTLHHAHDFSLAEVMAYSLAPSLFIINGNELVRMPAHWTCLVENKPLIILEAEGREYHIVSTQLKRLQQPVSSSALAAAIQSLLEDKE